ncbi:hypothetical protein GCT13_37610 [Paraburkholderia sp. CNPSo 3157]|uniref:Uncharacterized protein n=1 Tax=Paraburkholderia franconis TaxID=2654983 RepID=A0A7X1NJ50_9BURK|nr:hypothetical protein [Paraburkholderia franconis]
MKRARQVRPGLPAADAAPRATNRKPPHIKKQVKTHKPVRERVSFVSAEDAFQLFEGNTGGLPFSRGGLKRRMSLRFRY